MEPRHQGFIDLIGQIEDQTEATRILHTLLHYYLSGSARLDDGALRTLLQQNPIGEQTMQTLSEVYREQGRQQGEVAVLLRQVERKFGPPGESVRARIAAADADTLLIWSERILTADSLEAVLH